MRGFFMPIINCSVNYTTSGRKKRKPYAARKRTKTFRPCTTNATQPSYADIRMAEQKRYPSKPDTVGVAARTESPRYTGTYVKGIGTMHKSNAVPVTDDSQMKDIARMRR